MFDSNLSKDSSTNNSSNNSEDTTSNSEDDNNTYGKKNRKSSFTQGSTSSNQNTPIAIPNSNSNLHCEVINIKDYKKAAKTLQIAFADDLYVNYLTNGIKDPVLKAQMDLALFEGSVYSCILSGLVVGIRDFEAELTDPDAPFLAVALFEKPKHNSPEEQNESIFKYLWSMYQAGYLKFMWLANKETRTRVFEEQSQMMKQFKHDVLGPDYYNSWYLSDLGAIPKGRGKGLARRLVDFVCHNYIDVYRMPSQNGDDDDDDDEFNEGGAGSNTFNPNEESLIDSEIQSYNFQFDLESDTFTDYSGYSSYSDSDSSSAHSSWYYKEDQDILAQYDHLKSRGKQVGCPLYLESSHPRNRKIYQKLGFTYDRTVDIANVVDKDGNEKTLTMDLMVRGVKGAKWFKKEYESRPN